MKNIITLMASACFCLFSNAYAQQKDNLTIYGTVADSASKKPLEAVTITLVPTVNGQSQHLITPANGSFKFAGLKPGKYQLDAAEIGFRQASMPVVITKDTLLPIIYLAAQVQTLKEVKVQSVKPLIVQKPGKIIYDVQADPESKAKSVLDILHKIPFINVDANDNITVKGSTSFKVFINGKPSGMMDNNLTNILRTMPASSIRNIEVITVPPAKYDAEGIGGIINIITQKNVDNGFRGNLSASERLPQGGPDAGTSFTLKQGRFGVNGYGGAGVYDSPQTNFSMTRQSQDSEATLLRQNGYRHSNSRNAYFGADLSYEIDSLRLLSGSFSINSYHNDGSFFQSSVLSGSSGILQSYNLNNSNNGHGSGGDASLNYQLGFKADKNRLLTFSYRYSTYSNYGFNDNLLSDEVNYDLESYRQPDDTHTAEHTLQADFTTPVKKVTVEAGVKAIFRNDRSNYQYLAADSLTGQYNVVPGQSNLFHYAQDVFGVYNSYQFSLDKWKINAGVRAEQTHVNASFVSTATGVLQNYLNIVPSVAIGRPIGQGWLNLGFTQRLHRPGINRLNPFTDRSNPNFITTGNPHLRSSAVNNAEISYSSGNGKKLSFFLAADRIFVSNLDLLTTTFDPATQITSATYQNNGQGGGYTFIVSLNYNPVHWYSFSMNNNATDIMVSGVSGSSVLRQYRWMDNLSVSNTFRLDKGLTINAGMQYASTAPASLQAVSNAYISTSVSVNKEILKNKLYVSISGNNPFTKFRNNIITTTGTGFSETGVTQQWYRSVAFSLNYNFGRLKGDIRKTRKSIDNNDVNNKKGGL